MKKFFQDPFPVPLALWGKGVGDLYAYDYVNIAVAKFQEFLPKVNASYLSVGKNVSRLAFPQDWLIPLTAKAAIR